LMVLRSRPTRATKSHWAIDIVFPAFNDGGFRKCPPNMTVS
jgi:hypothetical protein